MKRVRKSQPEPETLASYRTRFAKAPTPPGWNGFKTDHRRTEPVKNRLREDQRGLCAYCENRLVLSDESVEHFIPRSADHSRELDWSSLLLCCLGGEKPLPEDVADAGTRHDPEGFKTCGHAKGQNATKILNPLELPAFPCLFRFASENGNIQPDPIRCQAAGISVLLAQDTISVLGLLAGPLNRARRRLMEQLLRQLSADGKAPAFSPAREREIAVEQFPVRGSLPAFFSTIRSFLGVGAEEHLRGIGFEG
jgi:uncharacterized protein (TIGR02646 family)